MKTKNYLVIGKAGVNLRSYPSTSYPTTTAAGHRDYMAKLPVITDWQAVNGVGSSTKYLPVLVNGKVFYAMAALLAPMPSRAAVLHIALNEMGAKSGKKYTEYYNKITNSSVKTSEAWCTQFAFWVLRQAGLTAAQVPAAHIAKDFTAGFSRIGRFYKSKHRGGTYTPKPGDVGWTSSNGDKATHTFLVWSVSGDTMTTFEGNLGGVAKSVTRKLSDDNLWGFGSVAY